MIRLPHSTGIGLASIGRSLGPAAVWALLIISIHPAPVSSTTVVEGALFDDLQNAQWVLLATIGPTRVETDIRGIPQTVYDLQDVRVVKGDEPPPFEIRIDGGLTDSGHGLRVPGVPEFEQGDRVLLFLRFDNPVCPIIGFQTRAFRVERAKGAPNRLTTYDGRPVVGLDERGRIRTADSAERSGIAVASFVELLAEMMQRSDYEDRSR
jgi:hypothetical protein